MKKIVILVLLFLSPLIAQTGKSVLSTAQVNLIKGYISDSLLTRDQKIDSIFTILEGIEASQVDSISITVTETDPPKLQVNVTWLDGRISDLISDSLDAFDMSVDALDEVQAYEPALINGDAIVLDGGVWTIKNIPQMISDSLADFTAGLDSGAVGDIITDSLKSADSINTRAFVVDDGVNDPVNVTVVGGISGESGLKVGETVRVTGESPSVSFEYNNRISDLVPPNGMSNSWDWALPDKSGTIATTDDLPDVDGDTLTQSYATLQAILDSLSSGTTGQTLVKNSNTDYDYGWKTSSANDIRIDYMWTYLALDSIPDAFSFTDSTGAAFGVAIESYPVLLENFDVAYHSIFNGEYRTYSAGWSDWTSSSQLLKAPDSVQVRVTSEGSTTNVVMTIGGVIDTFTVTPGTIDYTTDSLIYDYIYTSLTPGTVTANEWEDETANIPLTGVDGTPTMVADSGVVFNSGDDLYRACAVISDSLSIEMLIMMSDTATSEGTWAKARNGVGMEFHSVPSSNMLLVTATDGSTSYRTSVYQTPLHNKYVHVVATFDGASDPKVYFNGVLQGDWGYPSGNVSAGDNLIMGFGNGSLTPNEIIVLLRVYTKELTAGEISTNYGWAQGEGLVE